MIMYKAGGKLIIELSRVDVAELIANHYFVKNTPKELYDIQCGDAKVSIPLNDVPS